MQKQKIIHNTGNVLKKMLSERSKLLDKTEAFVGRL